MKLWVWVGPLVFVVAWWVISTTGWVNPLLLPSPPGVGVAMAHLATTGAGMRELWLTVQHVITAFFVSALVGVPLGCLLGLVRPVSELFELPIDFLRSLPAPAIYPVFMLFLGVGEMSIVSVATFASALVITVYSMHGVRNCSVMRLKAAKSLRLKPLQMLYRVILPEALPNIVGGLRVSLSLSVILVVVLEMFTGGSPGIGRRVFDSSQTFRIKEMYAAIAMIGLAGYGLNKLLLTLDNKFVHWGGR